MACTYFYCLIWMLCFTINNSLWNGEYYEKVRRYKRETMTKLTVEIIPYLCWHTSECNLSTCAGCGDIIFSENFKLYIDLMVNKKIKIESDTGIILCRSCYDIYAK